MRRMLGVTILAGALAASACAANRPPRTTPPPPPPPPPPAVLATLALVGWLPAWPPDIESIPVAAQLAEEAEPTAPHPAPERDRPPDLTPVPPVPAAEPPRLSTPETPDDPAATRQVRDTLERARRALETLRYERLSPDGRAQYDTVSQLIQQAEEALKARNLVFALKVADKAETLARRLSGR